MVKGMKIAPWCCNKGQGKEFSKKSIFTSPLALNYRDLARCLSRTVTLCSHAAPRWIVTADSGKM